MVSADETPPRGTAGLSRRESPEKRVPTEALARRFPLISGGKSLPVVRQTKKFIDPSAADGSGAPDLGGAFLTAGKFHRIFRPQTPTYAWCTRLFPNDGKYDEKSRIGGKVPSEKFSRGVAICA